MLENWDNLSPSEKFNVRFDEWMKPPRGVQFVSAEIERAYKERAQMFKDVTQLKKPTRVPIYFHNGFYPATYGGITPEEAMNDYAKLGAAVKKFNEDFLPDSLPSSFYAGSAKLFEILDYQVYRWPGHGVPSDAPYQCVEDEYMRADEYDALIADPSNYFLRTYLPRIFGAFTPWQKLAPMTDFTELPFVGTSLAAVGNPEVQKSFERFLEAGRAALEWVQTCGAINNACISSLGLVAFTGGFTKAPFDIVADTMRGTRGVMLDKFRQPEKILAAAERLAPLAIEMGVRAATGPRRPAALIPLHKGADGFMSNADFERFYLPSLKAMILGLVNAGVVPLLFVEGSYDQRLDLIAEAGIPKGTTVWLFDRTDMKQVKKKLGGWACFGGNVPVTMLKTSTPAEIKEYVKRLIDDAAQDGGFILTTGAVVDEAQPENLHALIDAGIEYGRY